MPVHLFRGCTFPDAQKIKVRSLAKLVYCHMVNIAPTDLLVYVSSVSFCLKPLLVTVVMCTQSKIQEKHYALEPDIAHFFFCAVKLWCDKSTTLVILKPISHIIWYQIMMEHSSTTLWYNATSIVQLASTWDCVTLNLI